MAQVPIDVQADQIINGVLGAANNVPPVAADPQDAVAVNQAAPAAPAEAQNLVYSRYTCSLLTLTCPACKIRLQEVFTWCTKLLNLSSMHVLAAGTIFTTKSQILSSMHVLAAGNIFTTQKRSLSSMHVLAAGIIYIFQGKSLSSIHILAAGNIFSTQSKPVQHACFGCRYYLYLLEKKTSPAYMFWLQVIYLRPKSKPVQHACCGCRYYSYLLRKTCHAYMFWLQIIYLRL